ncbi:anti-phage ZorAB system protein ZorA [Pelobacter seleniigenes]|uniref:anti-phage ZorAB system protein ZorA n=1 Tax=Pelobacter seleniigenes TaxID=407188 RepID=UPI0004A70CDC|nr:anti-phage ZorAB system protein ZorA [Pelobacter seleniigenes]
MQENIFSLARLIPDFSEIFKGNIDTPHGLSAFIVAILIVLTFGFLFFSISKYLQAKRHINFYTNLLDGITQDDLASRQRDITQKALEHKYFGKRWKEFDETLVLSTDGEKLYNTLDAEHFFNTSTLSRGLTENRLLAAVPGFLTAIGVIGTFAGLQMGLASLELSQDAGVDVLRQGIGNIISGASIAFLTSVWGVFTSVSFNFIEKSLERGIRRRIVNLQNHIDYLYPRINPEQSLVTIADLNRSSNETLQGLAEKIGDRLQEALVQTTNSIRTGLEDSLNQIMAPAIQSLVDNAQTGSQQALESLLDRFLAGVGDAGNAQKEMMQSASNDVRAAVSDLGQQMTGFLSRMDEQSRQSDSAARERQQLLEKQLESLGAEHQGRQKELSATFQTMFEKLVGQLGAQQQTADLREQTRAEKLDEQLNRLSARNNEVVNSIGQSVSRQLEDQQKRDEKRQQYFSESIEGLQSLQGDLAVRVESLMSTQQQTFDSMHQKFTSLQNQFEALSVANGNAGKEISQAAKEMQSVSNQLGILSMNIKQAAEKLGEDVSAAAKATVTLAEDNRLVSLEMQDALQGYQALRNDMSKLVEDLNSATQHAESGFSAVHKHLNAFQQALKNNIQELEDQLQKLMNSYADQVQSQTEQRLGVWNVETSNYISQMTNAARAMANVVNEMETKCSVA